MILTVVDLSAISHVVLYCKRTLKLFSSNDKYNAVVTNFDMPIIINNLTF